MTLPRKYKTSPDGFQNPVLTDQVPLETNGQPIDRRDFLRLAGFSLAAGLLWNGCARAPVHKAIPYLIPTENIIPGESVWQTAVCGACPAGCGMLVKIRDGRPIKVEGNPDHPLSRGGLCSVGQASLLGLYDGHRLNAPLNNGIPADWSGIDQAIIQGLDTVAKGGGAIRILTGTIISPTTNNLIDRFVSTYSGAKHVAYDPISNSAILDAHAITHGIRALPHYRFDNAEVIVGFEADFLGTWISPVEFTAAYATARNPDRSDPPSMSYHVQFESRLTITGAKADNRYALKPSEVILALGYLADALTRKADPALNLNLNLNLNLSLNSPCPVEPPIISGLAERLWQQQGRSLVVCGLQNVTAQNLCNYINHLLHNYGSTLDLTEPSLQQQGNDPELRQLLDEIEAGQVAALINYGVNPVYDLPGGENLAEKLKGIPLVVAISERSDETTLCAKYVCAESHKLESWWDAEPATGIVSVSQPALSPFGKTRTFAEMLSAWLGSPASDYDLIHSYWEHEVHSRSQAGTPFSALWVKALENGFLHVTSEVTERKEFEFSAVKFPPIEQSGSADFVLALHPTVAMQDGHHAYNPYLYELPDPITKTTWDNVATVSPELAMRLGVVQGDILRIEQDGNSVELPVYVFPGQADGVVGAGLGYGRKESSRFDKIGPQWLFGKGTTGVDGLVGKNVAPMIRWRDGQRQFELAGVKLTVTGANRALACTQEHGDLNERNSLLFEGTHPPVIVNEACLSTYKQDRHSVVVHHSHEGDNLWSEDHPNAIHQWAMAIDLNKCTGCSACIVSCNIENNIPIVGRDEVRRNRELHWLRIDRYYSEEEGRLNISFMPIMCQQCGHAPCETVCPVIATAHSEEGLNQQAYNRCVGTRYCANNCPYKVRRFNWFNYPFAHEGRERMILNPDVTVRSRGVMEKCSFCVQRIQEAKATAKAQGRQLADGDVKLACQQSCPAGAITFGDLTDPQSTVSKMMDNPRRYKVLEELNVRPAVGYLAGIRNGEPSQFESDSKVKSPTTRDHHGA